MVTTRTIQLSFFFILFGLTIVFSFFIFRPYLTTLVLAGAFAAVFYPLYRWLDHITKKRSPSLMAGITVFVATVILIVPTGFVGTQVFKEARSMYQSFSGSSEIMFQGDGSDSFPFVERARVYIQDSVRYGLEHINAGATEAFGWLASNAGDFSRQIGRFGIRLGIWVFAFYYLLRDGNRLRTMLVSLSPLSDTYDNEFVDRVIRAVKSVIGGSLIVALLQGAAAGLGMWIFGVPAPALWGLLAAIMALIPSVGTALILLPAAGYLFVFGEMWSAIGLAVWGLTIVNVIDNVLRPKLIERGIHIHPLLILLSVLGGIALLGPVGFLIGPIVVSVLVQLTEVYNKMVLHHRNEILATDSSKN